MSDHEERRPAPGLLEAQSERWERVAGPLLASLPYALLTVSTVLSVALRGEVMPGSLSVDVALAAAVAAWMLWWLTFHPAWAGRARLMRGFFAGWLALTAALVLHAPWFGIFSFSGYLIAGVVLHGR